MNRTWLGLGGALALALGIACAARGAPPAPAATEPPAPAPAAPVDGGAASADDAAAPLRCLPFATCGCFQEPECVAVRVHDDGFEVDIVDGPHAGETGHLVQDCPDGSAEGADCVDYIDPAMICRRIGPVDVLPAKYLCSMDHIHAGYRCGFRNGVCAVL
jgi:hypothetical protein